MSTTETQTAPGRPMVGKIQSDQEHAELLTYHLTVIRQQQAALETAKGPLESARAAVSDANEELTKAYNSAKGDLGRGYTREYLEGLIKDGKKKATELVDLETQRARDKLILNHPVYGQQPELFNGAETPTAARDEMLWEQEGYLRGRRGDIEELQKGDPPTFTQAIMRGFRAGQAATQEQYLAGIERRKAAENPDADAAPVNLNEDEGEGEQGEEEEVETPPAEGAQAEAASIERAKASLGVDDKKTKGGALKPQGGNTRVVRTDPVH